jgi:hypothetical protein
MAYVAGKAFCFPGPVTNKHCAESGTGTTDSGTDTWRSAMRRFLRTWPAIHSAKIGTYYLICSETKAPDNSERVVPNVET